MYEKMYENSKHALINIEVLLTSDSKNFFISYTFRMLSSYSKLQLVLTSLFVQN